MKEYIISIFLLLGVIVAVCSNGADYIVTSNKQFGHGSLGDALAKASYNTNEDNIIKFNLEDPSIILNDIYDVYNYNIESSLSIDFTNSDNRRVTLTFGADKDGSRALYDTFQPRFNISLAGEYAELLISNVNITTKMEKVNCESLIQITSKVNSGNIIFENVTVLECNLAGESAITVESKDMLMTAAFSNLIVRNNTFNNKYFLSLVNCSIDFPARQIPGLEWFPFPVETDELFCDLDIKPVNSQFENNQIHDKNFEFIHRKGEIGHCCTIPANGYELIDSNGRYNSDSDFKLYELERAMHITGYNYIDFSNNQLMNNQQKTI